MNRRYMALLCGLGAVSKSMGKLSNNDFWVNSMVILL